MLPSGLYPIRGLLYFVFHPTLFKSCVDLVLRLLLISLTALAVLWITTYRLQFLALSQLFGTGFLGRCAVLLALLAEAIIPVYVFSERFIRAVRNRLFDTVLRQQGISHLSALSTKERISLRTNAAEDERLEQKRGQNWGLAWRLGKYVAATFLQPSATESSIKQYMRMACTLPVTSLMPIGPIVYAYLNGFGSAAALMDHYLLQKAVSKPADREAVYQANITQFRMFGAVVFALNLVPIANWLFLFTNTVGAALWAADMERQGLLMAKDSKENKGAEVFSALSSTVKQAQSFGNSPMTRSQRAAHGMS
ncbi:hypothetical protein ABBQ38_006169 [Trebouxia sp. C0009 RCD-2024]